MKSELLYTAISNGDIKEVTALLTTDLDIETKNKALSLAADMNLLEITNLLIDAGANIDTPTDRADSILSSAVIASNFEMVRLLLNKGASVKKIGDDSPLLVASRFNEAAMIPLLLEKGANVNEAANDKLLNHACCTGLMFAAARHYYHCVEELLKAPDIIKDAVTHDGKTALILAITFADKDLELFYTEQERVDTIRTVQLLLAAGVNIEAKTAENKTALMLAAERGYIEVVQLLLEASANKNAQRADNTTALSLAFDNGHQDTISLLSNFESFEYRLNKIEYQGDIDKMLQCPISLTMMNDPITVSSGQTYDRASLMGAFLAKKDPRSLALPKSIPCPLTNRPITKQECNFGTSMLIKQHIESFVSAKETTALLLRKRSPSPSIGSFFAEQPLIENEENTAPKKNPGLC